MPKDTRDLSSTPPGALASDRAFDDYELALLNGAEPKLIDYFAPEAVPHVDLTAVDPGQDILPFAEAEEVAQPKRSHAAG